MTFTKGPWNIHHAYPLNTPVRTAAGGPHDIPPFDYWSGVIAQGQTILGEAHMQSTAQGWPHVEDVEEARANALLMTAAPDMYAALKDAEWGNNGHCPQCGMSRHGEHQPRCLIANALRKADGKAAQ